MSETTELTTEEKKKAINLEDLIYVKKHIADSVASAKEEIETDIKANSDATYYKKTDVVEKATTLCGSSGNTKMSANSPDDYILPENDSEGNSKIILGSNDNKFKEIWSEKFRGGSAEYAESAGAIFNGRFIDICYDELYKMKIGKVTIPQTFVINSQPINITYNSNGYTVDASLLTDRINYGDVIQIKGYACYDRSGANANVTYYTGGFCLKGIADYRLGSESVLLTVLFPVFGDLKRTLNSIRIDVNVDESGNKIMVIYWEREDKSSYTSQNNYLVIDSIEKVDYITLPANSDPDSGSLIL